MPHDPHDPHNFHKKPTLTSKFSKFLPSELLRLGMPALVGVTVFGVALYTQTLPTAVHSNSQKVANTQSTTHHTVTAPKTTPPPAPAPKTTAPAKPAPAVLSKPKPAPQAGTPKPEPVVTPSPNSSVSGLTPTAPAPTPSSSQTPSSTNTTASYTSTNWSGYLATNATFTAVSASWVATSPTGNGSTISADSTWIGIGGVTSDDLIQVGTQNIITAGGQVSTSAFYEMLPDVSQPVPGVTVSPGDSMTASLTEVSSGQWTISIDDQTDGQSYTATMTYASSLSSAEWIEEDPSFSFRRQIPFDNFHQAVFSAGTTIANGGSLTIAASTAQPVIMVDKTGQTVVAQPSKIGSDGASFTVTP